MKGKMNDFVRLHEAMQEKLKRASYSEQIQILTLLPECTVQSILMSLNTLLELYIKSKKQVEYQQNLLLKKENLSLMMMYGEGPPPTYTRVHHHHHQPLTWATANDFHYVIVLRVAIDYSHLHLWLVLRLTLCGLRHAFGSDMRIRLQTLYFKVAFSCLDHAFLKFNIQALSTAFAQIKGQ